LLGTARTIDPTDYRVPLAEANLLLDKDNYAQARKAALEAISRNPAAAHAWSLLGHMSVSSFDFETATSVATKLDALFELLPLAADGNDPQTPSSPIASPLGATLRVRIALRQDDPDSALAALEAIKPIAGRTALYFEYLTALRAAQYDQAAMDQASEAFSGISPGSADALFRAGQVLSDLRQYEKAVATLRRASVIEPNWAQPLIELGLVLVQAGLDDGPNGARAVLSQATALDPFNVRADNSLKLLKSFDAFKTIAVADGKIIIRHKPGLDARVAQEMVPVLQEIHARITATDPASLKHEPARPTMIELMPDHASFAVRIAGMPRIHTIAASTGPVIAMESPRDGKGHSGTYDWPRVIAHEYVHTVGLSRTGNRMPHWFTEAQAQYLERRPRDWSTVQLLHRILEDDELFDFEQINIAFTRPKKPTDRSQAYAQGHWMYEYLVKTFGTEAPLALMDEFAKGVREPQAFANVLKISREAFFDDFQAWARNELRQWGMIAPEGQESARTILTREAQRLLPEGSTQAPDPSSLTLAQLDELAKTLPDHAEIQAVVLTQLASQSGADFAALAPRLEAYAKLRPVDPMPHRALARYYLASGQVEKAIEHLKWLDIREDRQSVFASQIAAAYAQRGDFASAWPFAVRATHIAPYQGDHRELAAAIAVQRKDLASARQHLEFLAELEPTQNQHKRRLEALSELEKSASASGVSVPSTGNQSGGGGQ
jgi:cellulose synthase operon protein C